MAQQTYSKGRNGQQSPQTTLITDQRVDAAKKKLEAMKAEMIKVAGPLVDPDELVRFTLNAGIKNPKLFQCFDTLPGTASVFLSIITSRIIGIPCDGLHAFLVPFNQSEKNGIPAAMICQLIIGYKGFVQLALANPNVATFNAQPVFNDDKFDFEYGTESYLRHRPSGEIHTDDQLIWAYAEYKSVKGGKDFRVLSRSQIDKRRNVSKAKDDGPWKLWYPEMATKTAILSLAKVAPLGHKVQLAARVTERIEAIGHLTKSDVEDMRSASDSRNLGYTPDEAAFEPPADDRRQMEPAGKSQQSRQDLQQQEQPEPITVASLLHRIEDAEQMRNKSALSTIWTDTQAALGKSIDQGECDQIQVMIQEARSRMK